MTTTTEAAALAAIGAATRELHLPTVRERGREPRRRRTAGAYESPRLSRRGALGRDRRPGGTPRLRRVQEARFPRQKTPLDFDSRPRHRSTPRPSPCSPPVVSRQRRAHRPSRRLRYREVPPPHRPRHRRLRTGALRALRHLCPARQRARRGSRRTASLTPRRPLRAPRALALSMSSVTSSSTPAAPSSSSRFSPSGRRSPPSPSRRICRSRSGARSSPMPGSSPPSSIASPSGPTSSRRAPTATGSSAPAASPEALIAISARATGLSIPAFSYTQSGSFRTPPVGGRLAADVGSS